MEELRPMVGAVVVADDASPCTSDHVLRQCGEAGATVVRHHRNAGIARSLNCGVRAATVSGVNWLLTVDQDSKVPAGYVSGLVETARGAQRAGIGVGAVGAEVIRSGEVSLEYPVTVIAGWPTTAEVFQTGTLWNAGTLRAIGGFDEALGIDAVDAAACLALRESGFLILLSSGSSVEHGYGNSRPVRVFGRTVMATDHSPERRTTMVRNRMRLLPRELRADPAHGLRTFRRLAMNTALAVTVETGRWDKAKASIRGLLGNEPR